MGLANAGVCRILDPCPKDRDHNMPGMGTDILLKNYVFDKHRFCINSIMRRVLHYMAHSVV